MSTCAGMPNEQSRASRTLRCSARQQERDLAVWALLQIPRAARQGKCLLLMHPSRMRFRSASKEPPQLALIAENTGKNEALPNSRRRLGQTRLGAATAEGSRSGVLFPPWLNCNPRLVLYKYLCRRSRARAFWAAPRSGWLIQPCGHDCEFTFLCISNSIALQLLSVRQ